MLKRLRLLALNRVFGQGMSGFVAASAVGWLIDQLRAVDEPERLDVARLQPGETYVVTTRPAMSRAERRDVKRRAKVGAALHKESTPSRPLRRAAKQLDARQRKLATAKVGSKRRRKLEVETAELSARVAKLSAPSRRQTSLEAAVMVLDQRLEDHREHAIATARKKSGAARRPARTRTYR